MASNPQLSVKLVDGTTVTVTAASAATTVGGVTFGTGQQMAEQICQAPSFQSDDGGIHPCTAIVSISIVQN